MSRTRKDKEMVHFIAELQHTPAGIRYRKAWDEAQKALKAVYRINGESGATEAARDAMRRMYIARQEQASLALGVLVQTYQWPYEAEAAENFTYQPPARASRQRRTAP